MPLRSWFDVLHGPDEERPPGKKALLLSGGAPNATLMAGALCRLHEEGVRFDVISVSGAGTAVGLLYLVPAGGDPIAALRASVEQGIEDLLYRFFPINFKVFKKPGPLADAYRSLTDPWIKRAHGWLDAAFERLTPFGDDSGSLRAHWREAIHKLAEVEAFDERRLAHDLLDFWHSAWCPMSLSTSSEGCCAHPPYLDEFVRIDDVKKLKMHFYMNAFNLTKGEMEIFSKEEITEDHFHAALAYPFFYPPYRLPNGDYYIEGAAIDALNYRGLMEKCEWQIDTIVVLDVAGKRQLMHRPRGLIDAFAQSIMIPLIEVARDDTKLFDVYMENDQLARETLVLLRRLKEGKVDGWQPPEPLRRLLENRPRILKLPFEMSKERWERSLEWARSNLEAQFEIGYRAAGEFLENDRHRTLLLREREAKEVSEDGQRVHGPG